MTTHYSGDDAGGDQTHGEPHEASPSLLQLLQARLHLEAARLQQISTRPPTISTQSAQGEAPNYVSPRYDSPRFVSRRSC